MTTTLEHRPAGVTGLAKGMVSALETPGALAGLLAAGLAIRLVLARYSPGLAFDVGLFREWSDRLVARGPARFYQPGYFADYPPGYLYVLLVLGKLSRMLGGGPPSVAMLKLPAILADLGMAILAALLAARITRSGQTSRFPIRALAAGAILFNPALILVSAVWGQVDSVLGLLVLGSIYLLSDEPSLGRQAGAVALLAVAFATKPQVVFALPVVALVLAWPYLAGRAFSWRTWAALAARASLLAGLAAAVVIAMFAPFGVAPPQVLGFYRQAGTVYQFTSLWAFNLWGALGFYRPDLGPEAVSVAGVSAFNLGFALFALTTVGLLALAGRSLSRGVPPDAVALCGAVAVTCAAFALLTRMHERYLYLAVAGLAPFIAVRGFGRGLAALSVCFFLNLHFVYVFFSQHSVPPGNAWTIQPLYQALFGGTRDAWQLKVLSLLTVTDCLAVAGLSWRWLDRYAGRHSAAAPRTL